MKFKIKTMGRDAMAFCSEQAQLLGWNPGLHDLDVFHATDPAGWFMAQDSAGQTIGCVSAIAYDATFGFIGFFVVVPEHRGGRIGLELGRQALAYLGTRVIGQDGVFAKVANYETWGFQLAYRNLRYEWRKRVLPDFDTIATAAYAAADWPALLNYDARVFPCPRGRFLEGWLSMPEAKVRVVRESEGLVGWGLRRRCASGYKIGPLFADNPEIAAALLRELLQDVPLGEPVYLDVPEINREGVALVQALGMTECFGTARMYLNGKPDLDVGRIYGVTSFELG